MSHMPSIDVMEAAGGRSFEIVVTPPDQIQQLKTHFAAQSSDVRVATFEVAGDLHVDLLGHKTFEQVVGGAAIIASWHKAAKPQTPISL